MKKCINCGELLEDHALFCGECGTKQPEQKKFCSNCGTELNQNSKFCSECGTPVDNSNFNPIIPGSKITSQKENIKEKMEDFNVISSNDNEIKLIIQGVPLNLKMVKGNNYNSPKEILDFLIGETPVTQALWYVITGENPSSDISNLQFPVTNIDLSLATSFLVKLNKLTGIKFELPTLEQWNFAYKGGNKSKGYKFSGSNTLAEIGWNDNKLHPVGELYPNELGVMDMEGNVEEILKDNNWALISKKAKKKFPNDDLAGIRLVVNIPVDTKLETNNPLQKLIAQRQKELISQREEILREQEEARRKAEEETRKKAEEKARRKAEEEARKKAEEEARRKAEEAQRKEEEARRKAEEARRKQKKEEEARIKEEQEAKEKAEREAKIKPIKVNLPALKEKDKELKKVLDSLNSELASKKDKLKEAKGKIAAQKEILKKSEKQLSSLENRFKVVLLKRVDYGLFTSKGQKFDEVLMKLALVSKEDIKDWNTILKKNKKVTLIENQSKEKAEHWVSTINNAGGQAQIETSKAETDYKSEKEGYIRKQESSKKEITKAENTLKDLKNEIENLEKRLSQIENEYTLIHSDFKKNELELKFLQSNLSAKQFIKIEYQNAENRTALAEIFEDTYKDFHEESEKQRIKTEQEAIKKARLEEKKRLELEEKARKKAEEEKRKKEIKDMQNSVKGIALYSKDNNVEKAYQTIFSKDITEFDKKIENLKSIVNKAIKSGEETWEEYITDYYWNKSWMQYIIVDWEILVVKGNGVLPDVEINDSNEGKNIWHINPKVLKERKKIKYLVIMGNITQLGARYFKDFYNMECAVLADSIEVIGESTFFGDISLKEVKLPANLKIIRNGAFEETDLRQICLPKKVKKIESESFKGCSKLKTVLIPKEAIVENNAFIGCDEL